MDNETKYALAFNSVPDLGVVRIKKLYLQYGSFEKAWCEENLEYDELKIEAMCSRMATLGVGILHYGSKEYPEPLKNIYDSPMVLFYLGNIKLLNNTSIAIVGTRRSTAYGEEIAESFAKELSEYGITVVSGLALGIDTYAHKGALTGKGSTVGVLACGVKKIYPPENKSLYSEIIKKGLLISEEDPFAPPKGYKFPRRNRIIAGLSKGVIVIEGPIKSGAMITAHQALEEGREVFALPGSINSCNSAGPHSLIQQGAKLINNVEDIFEELNINVSSKNTTKNRPVQLELEEQIVYDSLCFEPTHVDRVFEKNELPINVVLSILTKLELSGIVRQLPGKYYVRSC